MKKSILLVAVLMALVSLCLVLASCDSGSSDSSDPTPPPAPVTCTVTFDANGGTGTMDDAIVEKGVAYTVPTNGFTAPKIPVGAVNGDADIPFAGWNTKADGSGTAYAAEVPISSVTADITLYAQWTKPLFSVSATKKVYFSKGNLYYDGSAFKFEENQYSFANSWDASHVSHFYWSKTASVASDKSYNDSDANTGDIFFTNETKETANPNFTVNGEKGKYRTLSKDEWKYLIETRSVNEGTGEGYSYQRARINSDATGGGVYGMILYPDNYTVQTYATSYTSDEWSAMEAAGCVFLPAAGYRGSSGVNYMGSNGYYWSATADGSSYAYIWYFSGSGVNPAFRDNRVNVYSVRLVCGE